MTDHDANDGHDHGDSNGLNDLALLSVMLMDTPAVPEPKKAEPYVEPDYNAIWSRRWRVINPVLLALGAIAIVALAALATRS